MSNEIKGFFSRSFSIIALLFMLYALFKVRRIGFDKSYGYFFIGYVFALIGVFIEYSRSKNYDQDDH